MPAPSSPIVLGANQPPARFYEGGARISAFRGTAASPSHTPEDWVASATGVRHRAPEGMTRLDDGSLLADAIAADPVGWLGAAHVRAFGADPKLLVKLLDAGQRLPVHAHPDDAFAARHLGEAHGKAEAWYLLAPGTVHIGLREDADPARVRELVDAQDTAALLGLLNAVDLDAGDAVWVPPGLLHAIGEGILLAEVQQPEDLSILLEWRGFDLDGTTDGHLDLGFDPALQAVTTSATAGTDLEALLTRGVADGPVLAAPAAEYFRLDRVSAPRRIDAGFSVLIGLAGETVLTTASRDLLLTRGMTVLLPAGAGDASLTPGVDAAVLVARPPAPPATAPAQP